MNGADCLIVIPTLNEEPYIGALLDLLLADTGADEALIVVADGGSTDATRHIVAERAEREPRLRLLHNPGRIQSRAINLAARRFGGGRRWLARIDAHAGYPQDYVSKLLAAAQASGASSVVVPMITADKGGCFQVAAATAQNSVLGTGGSAHRHAGFSGFVDHGHHALFDLAAFAAAGGYDEGFSHNEDAELDARLAAHGVRIWLAGDVAITYYPRATPGALWRQYFKYGEGRAKTRARHKSKLKLRQAVPLAVAPACAFLLIGLLVWPLAIPGLIWLAATLGVGILLGVKTGRPCGMASGTAAAIMHLAWSTGYLQQALFGVKPGPPPRPLVLDA